MNCCINCFCDAEIIDIIKGHKTKGKCSFCGSEEVYVYPIAADPTLADMFGELLDIYTPASKLPASFPKDKLDLLKNILRNKWSIFNVDPDCIYRLITTICFEKYSAQPELFDNTIGILESQDTDYLKEYSILGDSSWNNFVEAIKGTNRFHTDHINKDALNTFFRCARRKSYKKGKVFYRARICTGEKGFSKAEMNAPPANLATAGRVNPVGISVLYLSDSIKTTLHEIRAGIFDYVTVANFKLNKDVEVIDFANLDKLSPFIAYARGLPFTQQAVNIEHLRLISQEIAKPLRRHDSVLDYLPTQYLSDYIKSKNYAGVEYISTMCKDGFNVAFFDSSLFKCTKTAVYDIKALDYTSEPPIS